MLFYTDCDMFLILPVIQRDETVVDSSNSEKTTSSLREESLRWLINGDADAKKQGVFALWDAWQQGLVQIDPATQIKTQAIIPGRPVKPDLVPPRLVERRAMNTEAGRAALIHALLHIEFNAINLALDAIWRFTDMPVSYYSDWLKVAKEECYHFSLLNEHLISMGYQYGDFNAHQSLWEMAEKTQTDVLARMALVPRVYEAKGLDATPLTRDKLFQVGDVKGAQILDIILRDEIGHVTIGNYWYNWLCEKRSLSPVTTFLQLMKTYKAPVLRSPFNMEARKKAGFSEEELALFIEMTQ